MLVIHTPHFGSQTISFFLRLTTLRLPYRYGIAIYRLRYRVKKKNFNFLPEEGDNKFQKLNLLVIRDF
jgi:hypothetical protein